MGKYNDRISNLIEQASIDPYDYEFASNFFHAYAEEYEKVIDEALLISREADKEIENLTKQLNKVKQIYQNFIEGLDNV